MKKVLAFLLAVSASLSVGVTALADDIIDNNENSSIVAQEDSSSEDSSSEDSSSEDSSSEDSSSEDSSSEGSSSEGSSSEGSSSENGSSDSSSEEEAPAVDPSAFIFGATEDGTTLEDLLTPGKEYKFPVQMVFGSEAKDLTEDMLEDFKFTYSKLSTNGVKTFKIDEYKGKYYLHVEIKETTPLKAVQVKYNIKFVRKSNNLSVFAQQVKFEYGYEEANNDYINGLDKGDVIEVDNSNPIITDDQFDDIAKINDYKNVTLSGSDWKFTVNVTDESTKNFLFTNAGVKEVLAKFPEQEFKFFNFSGKPAFTATGKLELNVEDIVDEFDKMYVYRYANGKMYKLNASFDAEENTLSFRTNKLDTFVVTDKEIKDGTVVVENSSSDSSSDADKNNPETGASDAVNAAVAMAVASLATAGAVALKKFSK